MTTRCGADDFSFAKLEEALPYLIQLGLLHRTPRGRMATEAAYKHLGLAVPQKLETLI